MMCYILMIGILNMVEKCLSLTPSQKTYLNTLLIGMMENGSIKKEFACELFLPFYMK